MKSLAISDLHFPYHHPDTFLFLSDVLKLHGDIERVINAGDVVDLHAFSRFDQDPSIYSAQHETERAAKCCQQLEKLVGKREHHIVMGNHDTRISQRALKAGIPGKYIRNLSDILGVKWQFKDTIYLKQDNIFIIHDGSNKLEGTAVRNNMNVIAGHWHYSAYTRHEVTANKRVWALQMPCLIDPTHPAFAYAKHSLKRPIIGCALIEHNEPRLILMPMSSKGRYQPNKLVA